MPTNRLVCQSCVVCQRPFQARLRSLKKGWGNCCSLSCRGKHNNPKRDPVLRFWRFVLKTETCWLWQGSLRRGGYGRFSPAAGQSVAAHVFSYELHFGLFFPGLWVCHRCDTPSCVNPAHLVLGMPADNIRDAIRRQRLAIGLRNGKYTHPESRPRGSTHGMAKLTEEDIRRIRLLAASHSHADIARMFAVWRPTISSILRGKNWRHLT
jgi:hypothetical protein